MQAGIEVRNDGNVLTIDQTFFNYAFKSKHTAVFVNAGGPVTGGFGNQAFITVQGDAPIVAARSAYPFCVSRARKTSSGFEFGFISRHGAGAPEGATIEIFVFDRPTTSSNFGLQVFDEAGNIVFDSGNKYMKVVHTDTMNVGLEMQSVRFPGSGNYAYIISVPAFAWSGVQVSPTAPWQWSCRAGFIYSRNDGFDAQMWNSGEGSYASFGMPAPVASNPFSTIITVDVTGY